MRRGVSARRNPHRHHAAEARPLRTRRTCSWAWHAAVNPQTYVVMAFEIYRCVPPALRPVRLNASPTYDHPLQVAPGVPVEADFCARWQVAARAVERDARQVPSHAQHHRFSLGNLSLLVLRGHSPGFSAVCSLGCAHEQVLGHRKVSVVVRGLALG